MARNEFDMPDGAAIHEAPAATLTRTREATIVWLHGEQDTATKDTLAATLTTAIALDGLNVVVDIAGVTFLDASIVGALIRARNRLRAQSRDLTVRAPQRFARHVLDLCGVSEIIDRAGETEADGGVSRHAPAIGPWVAVPATESMDHGPARADGHRDVIPQRDTAAARVSGP
jgi:anti-anti-sigma factor